LFILKHKMKTLLNIGAIVLLIIGIVSWVILIGKSIIERYKKIKNES
jgi:hypothetical protein